MKMLRRAIFIIIIFLLVFFVFTRIEMNIFYYPDKLVGEYIDSIFDANLTKSKFLQTGQNALLDDFFGTLTSEILTAYSKSQKISRDEISFTWKLKSETLSTKVYEIRFERLSIGFLVDKIQEYRGYKENINGEIVDVPGRYPNLSFEEAEKLVRQNEKIPIFTKVLSLEVIRKNDKWLIGNADEIWYYLHPDLEQYRKIISK
jgi:hypothetical protein